MHRGFNYYYREGLKTSAKTIYRNKCFFRYILYTLVEILGRASIIFNPFFDLASMRQAYVIRKSQKLGFSSSFGGVGRWSAFGTYLLTLIFEGLILLAGASAVAVIAAILGGIGFGVSMMANANPLLYVSLFAAPAVPVLALYLLVCALIFSPTAYVILNNEGIGAGEVIGACYKTMINNGKMTVFWTYFVSYLLKLVYLVAMGLVGTAIFWFTPNKYLVLVMIAFGVIMAAGFLTFAPILTLTNRVVREHLYEDIVLDPVTAARVNEKVNLAVCNGKSVNVADLSQNLASLFDYTEDPYNILEATERKSRILEADSQNVAKKVAKNKAKGQNAQRRYKFSEEQPEKPADNKPAAKGAEGEIAVTAAYDISSQPEKVADISQPEAQPEAEYPETVAKVEPRIEEIPALQTHEEIPAVEAADIAVNQPLN